MHLPLKIYVKTYKIFMLALVVGIFCGPVVSAALLAQTLSQPENWPKKPKMHLPLEIYVKKTYKNLHLSFSSQNFLWASCQLCPTGPNTQLAENWPKKPKMHFPLNIYVKSYKDLHLSFCGRIFMWASCQGSPTSPNAQLVENRLKSQKCICHQNI